jgi:hypothetical protein
MSDSDAQDVTDGASGEALMAAVESDTKGSKHRRDRFAKAAQAFAREGNSIREAEARFDVIAFSLREGQPGYFGGDRFAPMATLTRDNGDEVTLPDPALFTEEAFDYYRRRAATTANPIHRARYFDVLWEAKRDPAFARSAFEAYAACVAVYLDNAEGDTKWGIELVDALDRVRQLAFQLNDRELKERAFSEHYRVLKLLKERSRYRWGLDIVRGLLEHRSKHAVDLQALNEHVQSACKFYDGQGDFYWFQIFTDLRGQVLRALGATDDARQAHLEVADSLLEEAALALQGDQGSLLAVDRIKRALEIRVSQGASRDDIDDATRRLKEATSRSVAGMKAHVVSVELPRETVDNAAKALEQLSLRECLQLIAVSRGWIPSVTWSREQAEKNAKKYVLGQLFPTTLVRNDNPAVVIHGQDEKLEYATIEQFRIAYELFMVSKWPGILKQLRDKGLSDDAIIEQLRSSPVFGSDRLELLRSGIANFLSGDFVAAIHVLAIQIEGVLRDLAAKVGRPTSVRTRSGIQERQLDSLLTDEVLRDGLGEDFVYLLTIVLADKRGDNLRHDVAHGLLSPKAFNEHRCSLLVLILLRISGLRLVPVPTAGAGLPENQGSATAAEEPDGGGQASARPEND